MTKNLVYAALAALLLAACRDESPFIPLSELCTAYAQEVCEAREACACGSDACQADVERTCDAELAGITDDDSLSYDGERADRVRDDLREHLLDCSAPFSLARFFEGALPVGEACTRDSQCVSQRCEGEPARCLDAEPAPLCVPAET